MSTDKFDDLPNEVARRAEELHEIGVAATKAVGLAVDGLAYGADWERSEVAEAWGVEKKTLLGYKSKGDDEVNDALRLVVADYGGDRVILSDAELHRYNRGRVFVVAEFRGSDDYAAACSGDARVAAIRVTGGSDSGQPGLNLSIDTTHVARSLDELAEEVYRSEEFGAPEKANLWYSLLVDAGVDEESLQKPGETLPPSHPDSSEHFQYQMRSLEPDAGCERRPPGR